MKLSAKIGLSFFAVTVICTVAAVSFLYFTARTDLQRAFEVNLESMARSRTAHIETYLGMLKISVGQLSKSVVLENYLRRSDKDNLQQSHDFEQTMTRLRQTKEGNPSLYELLLLDTTGMVIASSNEKNIGADKSGDVFFSEGQKGVFIKDAYYLESINEPLIAVSVPLPDSQTAELLGVLVARVKLKDLWSITDDRTGLRKTGEIIVVNKHRVMITPSRFIPDAFLKQKADTEGVRQAFLRQDKGFIPKIFADYRGVPVMAAHGYIPQMQWVVIAKIDAQEAFAPLIRLRWIFFVILFGMVIVAWLLSRGLAKLIAGPIKKLHEGTEIIGSGNLDYKVGTDANDEVGQLSRAFDKMTENLKTTTTSIINLNNEISERKRIEEKLRERTVELFEREEDLAMTLRSIGDAMIATDTEGRVTRMNPVAEHLTGWSLAEAFGKPLQDVFCVINAQTRAPANNPIAKVLASGQVVGLANHTALIARDGTVRQIADSAAPIRAADGRIRGVVLVFHDVSSEYQIKEVLRESEQRFRGLVSNMPGIVYRCANDSDGTMLYMSGEIDPLSGYPAADFINNSVRSYASIIHRDDRDQVCRAIQAGVKAKTIYSMEYRICRADGKINWAHERGQGVFDPNGNLLWRDGVILDITERKRAEDELREKTKELEGFFNVALDLLCIADLEGRFLKVNKVWEDTLGYPVSELESRKFLEFVHPEDMQATLNAMSLLGKGENILNFTNRYKRKDGSYKFIEWRSAPYGNLIYAAARDITERKQAEDKIKEAKEDWERTFDTVTDLISIIDTSHHVARINKAMADKLGLKPEEVIGRLCYESVHGTSTPPATCPHSRLLTDGQTHTAEIHEPRLNGDFLVTCSPLYDAAGKLIGSVHVARDITEQKKAAEALRQAKTDLEKAYRQLQDAFELESKLTAQAQSASAAKSQFVANISHEIRTPLNGVMGICELLLETKMTKEQLEYVQIINMSAEALLNIINATLDFSKIEAGKMGLEHIDFGLRVLLEDIVSVMNVNAAKKKLEMVYAIDPNVPPDLNGDPGRLRQILINLIGNAIKFTHKGKITVAVALAEQREGTAALRFSVRDTGIGIPADKTNLLFNAFSQVDASMARKFGGTGLGLAISKGLVEQMAGSIGVDSVQGEGSTFWFVIPFIIRPPDARSANLPSDSGKGSGEARWHATQKPEQRLPEKRLRILVAEDNMANQIVILGILKKMGHVAVAVADGNEVVKALETIPYDLVLMDIQMPEMDGLEAAAVIRDQKSSVRNHNIPILALTAHNMPEDKQACLAAGMNGAITKPVSTKSVADAIAGIAPSLSVTTDQIHQKRAPSVVFDSKAFADRLSGDSALMREVIGVFMDETPKSMRALENAINKQQKDEAVHLAHTIKGSAANVGGNQLRAVAARIEQACGTADWREAEVLLPRFNKQFEFLERAMQEFLKT